MAETPEQYAKRLLEIILKSKDLTLDSPLFPENQPTVKAEAEVDPIAEIFKEFGLQPPAPVTKAKSENPIDEVFKEFGINPESLKPKPETKPKTNKETIDEMLEKAKKGEPIE